MATVVENTVPEKELEGTHFTYLSGKQIAQQLTLGADLVAHPTLGNLIKTKSLVDIDPALAEHGLPPQYDAVDEVKDEFSDKVGELNKGDDPDHVKKLHAPPKKADKSEFKPEPHKK